MQEYKRIDVNELIVNSVLLFKFYQFIHLRWEVGSPFHLEFFHLYVFFGSQFAGKLGTVLGCAVFVTQTGGILTYINSFTCACNNSFRRNSGLHAWSQQVCPYIFQTDPLTVIVRSDNTRTVGHQYRREDIKVAIFYGTVQINQSTVCRADGYDKCI